MLLSTNDVLGLQAAAGAVDVDPVVQDYAVRLVLATRPVGPRVEIGGLLAYGASPRASIGLIHAGRALALLRVLTTCCRRTCTTSPTTC